VSTSSALLAVLETRHSDGGRLNATLAFKATDRFPMSSQFPAASANDALESGNIAKASAETAFDA
jgi:hypothetical protein